MPSDSLEGVLRDTIAQRHLGLPMHPRRFEQYAEAVDATRIIEIHGDSPVGGRRAFEIDDATGIRDGHPGGLRVLTGEPGEYDERPDVLVRFDRPHLRRGISVGLVRTIVGRRHDRGQFEGAYATGHSDEADRDALGEARSTSSNRAMGESLLPHGHVVMVWPESPATRSEATHGTDGARATAVD